MDLVICRLVFACCVGFTIRVAEGAWVRNELISSVACLGCIDDGTT